MRLFFHTVFLFSWASCTVVMMDAIETGHLMLVSSILLFLCVGCAATQVKMLINEIRNRY